MRRVIAGALVLCGVVSISASGAKAGKATGFPAAASNVMAAVLAESSNAVVTMANNRFCPITGKPVNVSVPPVDSPQKYRHEHILVSVATPEAGTAAAAGSLEFRRLLSTAAAYSMMLIGDPTSRKVDALEWRPIVVPRPKAALPPAVSVALVVDASNTYQTIDGFGTATYAHNRITWEQYAKPAFQKLVVEDLGLSMIRTAFVPAFFEPVEKPEQITRAKFQFDGVVSNAPINAKTGKPAYGPIKGEVACLEFISALVKLDTTIKVVPSVWSPPYWMKDNNAISGGHLRPECYPLYARYLAEWIRFAKEKYGINVYALSPQNELNFREPYDSCVYTFEEYPAMLKVLGKTLAADGLAVKLYGPEDMTHMLDRTLKYLKAVNSDPEAAEYLAIIATHGYAEGVTSVGSVRSETAFWEAIKKFGKPSWMTETGAGPADDSWHDGGPDGQVIVPKTGLRQSGVLSSIGGRLHYALAYGNVSAWLFWQITGPRPGGSALCVQDKPTKKFHVAKHFYKWIRPGAVRIAAGPDGGDKSVCVSAYQHAKNKTVTIVLLNRDDAPANVTMAVKTDVPIASFEQYRTSETEDCAKLDAVPVAGGTVALALPPRCIVTLFGQGATKAGSQ